MDAPIVSVIMGVYNAGDGRRLEQGGTVYFGTDVAGLRADSLRRWIDGWDAHALTGAFCV